jgi:chemotaxis protein histidine kinase CheA
MENEIVRAETQSVSGREVDQLAREIQYYWRKGQAAVLDCAIEIGRRLTDAKGMLPHGEFGKWVDESFEFSHSSANTFMKLFDEYGADQLTLFGAVTESQTFANLPYSKALALLAVPREEREDFAKEVGAEELSVRELKKAIEDRKAAEARERELEDKLAAAEIAKAAAEALAKEADESRAKVEKLEADLKKRRESELKLKDKLKAAESNPKIPEDVLTKLKEEAEAEAKAAQGAEIEKKVAEARAEAGKGTEEILKQLEEAKAAQEAAESAQAQAEAIAKEATANLTEAQKKLKMASPTVTEFKALFEQVQEIVKKMRAKIEVVRAEDPETATRLEAAMKAFGGSL